MHDQIQRAPLKVVHSILREVRRMNKVVLMGRLTRDPEVRYSAGENAPAIAEYTLAVDIRFRRDGGKCGFIPCVSFGHYGGTAEKYFRQGLKVCHQQAVFEDRKLYQPADAMDQGFTECGCGGSGVCLRARLPATATQLPITCTSARRLPCRIRSCC